MTELEELATNDLPFEIEKWLITIKAHCTVIAEPGPDDDVQILAACIKINVDDELRPLLLALTQEKREARSKALEDAVQCATNNDKGEIEQNAFEQWAIENRYDMDKHPLHWLFLNSKTSAARDGWRAAMQFVEKRIRALTPGDTP